MKPIPKGPLGKEPAGTIGSSISFVLMGLWMLLKANGVDVTEDVSGGVELMIWGLLSVPAISGWLTRFFVFSPATTQKEINDAAAKGAAGQVTTPPPEVINTNPAYDPNDPTEVPPRDWATNAKK